MYRLSAVGGLLPWAASDDSSAENPSKGQGTPGLRRNKSLMRNEKQTGLAEPHPYRALGPSVLPRFLPCIGLLARAIVEVWARPPPRLEDEADEK